MWFNRRNTSAKMTLLDPFRGERGRCHFVEALAAQRLVSGNRELAEDLADCAEALAVPAGQTLISREPKTTTSTSYWLELLMWS